MDWQLGTPQAGPDYLFGAYFNMGSIQTREGQSGPCVQIFLPDVFKMEKKPPIIFICVHGLAYTGCNSLNLLQGHPFNCGMSLHHFAQSSLPFSAIVIAQLHWSFWHNFYTPSGQIGNILYSRGVIHTMGYYMGCHSYPHSIHNATYNFTPYTYMTSTGTSTHFGQSRCPIYYHWYYFFIVFTTGQQPTVSGHYTTSSGHWGPISSTPLASCCIFICRSTYRGDFSCHYTSSFYHSSPIGVVYCLSFA